MAKNFKNPPLRIVIDDVTDYNENYKLLHYHLRGYENLNFCGLIKKEKIPSELDTEKDNPYIRFVMYGNGAYINWLGIDK